MIESLLNQYASTMKPLVILSIFGKNLDFRYIF